MKLILLTFLLVMIAVVSVVVARRRREQTCTERAKALRFERSMPGAPPHSHDN